ncbi:Uncharacterised protein [Shigella sonnei]|nr:Uncharacterised protein [Shigella sonnei]
MAPLACWPPDTHRQTDPYQQYHVYQTPLAVASNLLPTGEV